jgi:hypothetical protein
MANRTFATWRRLNAPFGHASYTVLDGGLTLTVDFRNESIGTYVSSDCDFFERAFQNAPSILTLL